MINTFKLGLSVEGQPLPCQKVGEGSLVNKFEQVWVMAPHVKGGVFPLNTFEQVSRRGPVVMRELYSVGCIGVLPFIEDLSETLQSGLVASSHGSEEHA